MGVFAEFFQSMAASQAFGIKISKVNGKENSQRGRRMGFEFAFDIYCQERMDQVFYRVKWRPFELEIFVKDAAFSGIRKGVLSNDGSEFRSAVLPVFSHESPPPCGIEVNSDVLSFKVRIQKGEGSFEKEYPIGHLRPCAIEWASRLFPCKLAVLQCRKSRFLVRAWRATKGGPGEERENSSIQIAPLTHILQKFRRYPLPITPERHKVATGGPFPVFLTESTLKSIRELSRARPQEEVGGFLVGQVYQDIQTPEVFLVVTDQIPAIYTQGGGTHLTFTSESWASFWDEMEKRRHKEALIGWWHSHPLPTRNIPTRQAAGMRDSSLFMSLQDEFLHRRFFREPFQVALIFDPAAEGEEAHPGRAAKDFGLWGWQDGVILSREVFLIQDKPKVEA